MKFKNLLITLFISIVFFINSLEADAPETFVFFDYESHIQRVYEESTNLLIFAIDEYIKNYAEDSQVCAEQIVNICDEYNMDIKLLLAQAHLESHFGTRGKAAYTNSIFNVGTYDNGQILYRYKHPNESIEPYVSLMKRRYLNDKEINDLLYDSFVNDEGKRFASNSAYENALMKLLELIDTTTIIDSLIIVRQRTGLIQHTKVFIVNEYIANKNNNKPKETKEYEHYDAKSGTI